MVNPGKLDPEGPPGLEFKGAVIKPTRRVPMNWKAVKVQPGGKLFKVHNFTYMIKGVTYHLEVDEFHDGTCTGHGEHSTDKNSFVESVNAKSLEEGLNLLIERIGARIES